MCLDCRLKYILVNIFHITISMEIYSIVYQLQANIFHYHQYSIFFINMENKTRYKMSIVYDTSCKPAFMLLLLSVNYFSAVVNCLHGTLVCLVSCIYLVKVDISSFPHLSRKWRNQ